MPRLLIFASGTKTSGGSGFEKLVWATRAAGDGRLEAEIVGVVSNHEQGGVRERADRLGIPFHHFAGPFDGEGYLQMVASFDGVDFVGLFGWMKLIIGLDPRKTINIHPGPLPLTKGMHGAPLYETVLAAYRRGEILHTQVSMHFVTPRYDEGPVFLIAQVPILDGDTVETLSRRVNRAEHEYQATGVQMVLSGAITWDGIPGSHVSKLIAPWPADSQMLMSVHVAATAVG
ncbi:MAG: formyltransferase family protein [Candidatus Magasanikbacteria bacterium]|nr:formyltransferase family protein [Candidatus Magasanikbacteria bacterium]